MTTYELRIGTPSEWEAEEWPPEDAVHVSDWSYMLGESDDATGDGPAGSRRWDQEFLAVNDSDVIVATGLDFPTANVFRVQRDETLEGGGGEGWRRTTLPVPAVGQSLFYRWYIRPVMYVGLAGNHPIQDGNSISTSNWAFRMEPTSATQYQASFEFDFGGQSAGHGWFGGHGAVPSIVFTNHVTYRWEVHLFRNATGTFQFHVRVYNSAGTLLYTDANFPGEGNAGANGTLANNPSLNFVNVNNLAGLNCGTNRLDGGTGPQIHSYQAGFMVRTDDWCGPYQSSEEDWNR